MSTMYNIVCLRCGTVYNVGFIGQLYSFERNIYISTLCKKYFKTITSVLIQGVKI